MVVRISEEKKSSEQSKNNLKQFWNWLWNSESLLSYLVFLVIVFIFVKFIFLPGLSLAFGMGLGGLPLAIVESSSMEHYSLQISPGDYDICGTNYGKTSYFNPDAYWSTCGSWYEQNTNITKAEFQQFKLSNGFRKGDLIVIFGKKSENIKVGDIIIFNAGRSNPIIHRVISLNPIQTKGDHNPAQLAEEKNISPSQIIGVAVAKVPKIGWIKLGIVQFLQKIFG